MVCLSGEMCYDGHKVRVPSPEKKIEIILTSKLLTKI